MNKYVGMCNDQKCKIILKERVTNCKAMPGQWYGLVMLPKLLMLYPKREITILFLFSFGYQKPRLQPNCKQTSLSY